jgi:RNA 2',3'-cyclic 3'-phosphodiesterase
MPHIRTFIAVDVSPEVSSRIDELIGQLRSADAKATWTKPGNVHLTLKFLGDTDEKRIPDVCRVLADVARQVLPFQLRVHGAGAFPSVRRPRTVWVGVTEGEQEVCALADAVERALQAEGFPRETRQFSPHVTVGRVRERGAGQSELGRRICEMSDFEAGTTLIEEAVVYASFLDPKGPTYKVLGRAPFAR